MINEKEIGKWFKRIMIPVNCLFAIPVIWVLIKEFVGPQAAEPWRVLTTAGLVALPLCGTMAITIAGSAVLGEK